MVSLKKLFAFTLIEVMITVALVGILATIAVPTYRNFIENGRATEAQANLYVLYTAQKLHALNNAGDYLNLGSNGAGLDVNAINTALGTDIVTNYYKITAITADNVSEPHTFFVQATETNGGGRVYGIDQSGVVMEET